MKPSGRPRVRGNLRERVLPPGAMCVYCGGVNPATSIDHAPPKAMFDGKIRPEGLEVPACKPCHDSLRAIDLLTSMIGWSFPDGETPRERATAERLITGVGNNIPGALEAMYISDEENARLASREGTDRLDGGYMSVGHPAIQGCVQRFATRVAIAVDFAEGHRILGPGGGALSRWFTNVSAMRGELPQSISTLLAGAKDLRQGTWTTSDQFGYRYWGNPESSLRAVCGYFRFSIAFLVALSDNLHDLWKFRSDSTELYAPGFLRNYDLRREFI